MICKQIMNSRFCLFPLKREDARRPGPLAIIMKKLFSKLWLPLLFMFIV